MAATYVNQYQRTRELRQLDAAIAYELQAVKTTSPEGPQYPVYLVNLGTWYILRYQNLEDLTDLGQALYHLERSELLTGNDHSVKSRLHSMLGEVYRIQFDVFRRLEDIDKAIEHQANAVSRTPDSNPDKYAVLQNLGNSFDSRFKHTSDLSDLDQAIYYMEHATKCYSEKHPNRWAIFSSLGNLHYARHYPQEGRFSPPDLDQAILYKLKANLDLPDHHAAKCEVLNTLASQLRDRYKLSHNENDRLVAVDSSRQAAQSKTGHPRERSKAARFWAMMLVGNGQIKPGLDVYQYFMELVPLVVWLGLKVLGRFEHTSYVTDTALEACCFAALHSEYRRALELLEQGRCIIWNQILQLRTPLDELKLVDPTLAKRLASVSKELHDATALNSTINYTDTLERIEDAAQRHRRLAEEWELLIQRASSLPSMAGLLTAKTSEHLVTAAHSGAVVVINVHSNACHALVVRESSTCVEGLTLTLTDKEVALAFRNLSDAIRRSGRKERGIKCKPNVGCESHIADTLKMLWFNIAKPILLFLRYVVCTIAI